MLWLIVSNGRREIRVAIRNTSSVPDVLKACKALGFDPERWAVEDCD